MHNRVDISWLSPLKDNKDSGHPFFFKYIRPANMPLISRKGIYSNCWDYFSNKNLTAPGILQKSHSLFLSDEMLFFNVTSEKNTVEKKHLLIIFLLDPWLMPIYCLEDSLNHLKTKVDLNNFELHAMVECFSAFSPGRHVGYLNAFYQNIAKILGKVPFSMELLEIKKMSNMKDWRIYESGTSWLCSDNYVVHLALSKGADLIDFCQETHFKKIEDFAISRHHSIEVGRIEKREPNDIFNLYDSLSGDAIGSESFNELKVPDAFMTLVYKVLGSK